MKNVKPLIRYSNGTAAVCDSAQVKELEQNLDTAIELLINSNRILYNHYIRSSVVSLIICKSQINTNKAFFKKLNINEE